MIILDFYYANGRNMCPVYAAIRQTRDGIVIRFKNETVRVYCINGKLTGSIACQGMAAGRR